MRSGYSFRPRLWAFALAALGCAGGIALGNWQSGRAEEKRAVAAQLDAAQRAPAIPLAADAGSEVIGKKVAARGEFLPRHTVFLGNRSRHGKPGYEVVTPLRLAQSSAHVLVQRGWRPAGGAPDASTPAGTVSIEGIAQARLPHTLALGAEAPGAVRQNLEIGAFAAETGLSLRPFAIQQSAGPDDGLARDWPRPDAGVDKHEAYALQWYSLAALCVILAVALSFRRVEASRVEPS